MEQYELLSRLTSHGFFCRLEPSFDGLADITHQAGRIVVGENREHLGEVQGGIGIWLHSGSGLLFVATWLGVIYLVPEADRVVNLLEDVFSGKYVRRGTPPYSLPKALTQAYGLLESDLMLVVPKTPGHSTSTPGFAHFVKRICPRRLTVGGTSDVLTTGRFRSLSLITRPAAMPGKAGFPLLISSQRTHSRDHALLYTHILGDGMFEMFDTGWAWPVTLNDPYYCRWKKGERPEEPLGWESSEEE